MLRIGITLSSFQPINHAQSFWDNLLQRDTLKEDIQKRGHGRSINFRPYIPDKIHLRQGYFKLTFWLWSNLVQTTFYYLLLHNFLFWKKSTSKNWSVKSSHWQLATSKLKRLAMETGRLEKSSNLIYPIY